MSDAARDPGNDLEELASRLSRLARETEGDPAGLALVRTLVERAEALPPSGRARLLARAESLLATYRVRVSAPPPERRIPSDDGWREALAARAKHRAPRARSEERATELVAEIRATAATSRAAEQVPEAAGPYNGAAVASRALDELYAISPAWVGSYVAWLEDLASLADLPERRAPRKKA